MKKNMLLWIVPILIAVASLLVACINTFARDQTEKRHWGKHLGRAALASVLLIGAFLAGWFLRGVSQSSEVQATADLPYSVTETHEFPTPEYIFKRLRETGPLDREEAIKPFDDIKVSWDGRLLESDQSRRTVTLSSGRGPIGGQAAEFHLPFSSMPTPGQAAALQAAAGTLFHVEGTIRTIRLYEGIDIYLVTDSVVSRVTE